MRSGDLTKNRLAFLSGLLHDLGKLSLNFIKSKEPDSTVTDFHGQIFWQDRDLIPDSLWRFINESWEGESGISIAKLVCSHHGCQRCLGPAGCPGLEDHPTKKLLQTFDRCETSNPSDLGKQFAENMQMESLVGTIKTVDPFIFDSERHNLYAKLDEALSTSGTPSELAYAWTVEVLKATTNAFSETRKCSTDLTLGAHLLSTAILFSLGLDGKPILCTSMPASESYTHGYSIGDDGTERAMLTIQRNNHQDEIFHDKFTPFDEFIWLLDALPNNEPSIDDIIGKCRSLWVKQPEDIEPGYTFDKLNQELDRLKDLAKLSYAQDLVEKRQSWGRHLKNLKKAEELGKLDPQWLSHERMIESRLEEIDQVLATIGNVKEILARNDWKDCPKAYDWAWFFLAKTMSPIRPTSPVAWARRILEEDPFDSKESAVKWVLGRRLTLGRWLALKIEQVQKSGSIEALVADCLNFKR